MIFDEFVLQEIYKSILYNPKIDYMEQKYSMPSFTDFLEETDGEKLRYMIGGYTKTIQDYIQKNTLYPIIAHTQTTIDACDTFLANINQIDAIIPKNVIGIDPQTYKIQYTPLEYDDIVDRQYKKTVFVKKRLAPLQNTLMQVHDVLLHQLEWNIIGMHSTIVDYGYIFTQHQSAGTIHTYLFSIKKTFTIDREYRVKLRLFDIWRYSYSQTFYTKKLEYTRKMSLLDGIPIFLLVSWNKPIPQKSTIIPLIQEYLPIFLQSHAI